MSHHFNHMNHIVFAHTPNALTERGRVRDMHTQILAESCQMTKSLNEIVWQKFKLFSVIIDFQQLFVVSNSMANS